MATAQLKKRSGASKRGGNRGGDRTRVAKVVKRTSHAAGKDPHRNAKRAVGA